MNGIPLRLWPQSFPAPPDDGDGFAVEWALAADEGDGGHSVAAGHDLDRHHQHRAETW